MSDELFFGWSPEHEEKHDLTEYTGAMICSAPDKVPASRTIPWKQRNQRQRPFCHAHMSSGMSEVLAGNSVGSYDTKFSRYFAAITDMRMDGDDRVASGASISGSLKARIKFGDCLDQLKPYLGDNERYSNAISDTCTANAAKHHIKSLTPKVTSYDQWKAMAITGRYVLGFGLYWTQGLASLRGLAKYDGRPIGSKTGVLGGHAVMSTPQWITVNGDLWFPLDNSHDGWGTDMKVFLPPKVWDTLLSSGPFGAWAASDIALDDMAPKPIELDFSMPDLTL